MTPRLASGRKLHYIGPGYVVLMNGDQERSARMPINVWHGWDRPGKTHTIFEPLDTNVDGEVEVEATGRATHFVCVLDDDGPIAEFRLDSVAYEGSPVRLSFEAVFEGML